MEQVFTILPYVSVVSTFVPAVLAVLFFKIIKKKLSPILFLVALSLVTELICAVLPFYTKGSNMIVFNLYPIFEIALLSWFYAQIIDSKTWKFIIFFVAVCFSVNSGWFIFTNPYNKLNNVALAIESICIMVFSLVVFYYLMKELKYANILAVPAFWVNVACLLFFGGNLFLHVFSNSLLKYSLYDFFALWGFIHSSLNISFYLLITVAFWKTRKLQA